MLWIGRESGHILRASARRMHRDQLISKVRDYYGEKIKEHGATARGVDWNSTESQELRFEQLLRVADRVPRGTRVGLNDFGCGYGALRGYAERAGLDLDYRGFDVAPEMVEEARRRNPTLPASAFVTDVAGLQPTDFTVASGIFNVKLTTPVADWQAYVQATLDDIARLSRRGFAFNMLTSYSDADRMRPDLYYGDPCQYFDVCKRKYSKWVALLHDYGLYEFTILVRLEN
jgi:hypothetical protein